MFPGSRIKISHYLAVSFAFICYSFPSIAQNVQPNSPLHFRHISSDNGLSQNTINCIFQDSQGFLWFGTQDGLNKYDGYTFEIFKKQSGDTNSISHNWIWDIHEDKSGIFWIATWWGLNRYDPGSGIFTRYLPDDTPGSISNSRPTAIEEDLFGNLWIGTWGGGLNLYLPESDRFTVFRHDQNDINSISNNFIRTLCLDRGGILWIGTWNGLCSIPTDTSKLTHEFIFKRYLNDPENPGSISGNRITSICEDSAGDLWVGTMENGLNRFNLLSNRFNHYKNDPRDAGSISADQISSIYKDSEGSLWIATQDQGLNRFIEDRNEFAHFKIQIGHDASLSSNKLLSLYEDESNILWIGTATNGLNKLNLRRKKFFHYSHSETEKNSLSGNLIRCFFQDQDGYLWIGTAGTGLNRFDPRSGQFKHFRHDPDNPSSLSHDNIQSITGDLNGYLWIGTFGGGLDRLDPRTSRFIHFKHNPGNERGISSNYIETLCTDSQGYLWIGTSDKGLDRLEIASGKFDHFRFEMQNPLSISTNYILSIYEDYEGNIWVGGWGGGLNRYDRKLNHFIRYLHDPSDPRSLCDNIVNTIYISRTPGQSILWVGTSSGLSYMYTGDTTNQEFNHLFEKDGLPNQHIYGILEDTQGNLWMSTNKGLSKYSPFKKFKNFDSGDGLPSDEFSGGAYYRSQDGQFYFGCPDGFITFLPDSIEENKYIPPIVITSFKKFNKPVSPGKRFSNLAELKLSYRDYVFSFEFSSLDYSAPGKNQYAYKMEGFNENWIFTDSRSRNATFTHLDPGEYKFKVIGSNSDGIWNETGTSLKIIVSPPFWQTRWFRISIGLLVVGLILTIHLYRINHLKQIQKNQVDFSNNLMESQEAERKRIAAELHDSLGQNLLIANNELQQYMKDSGGAETRLQGLVSIIKESINEVREISHNLHPHQLDSLGLTKAIESMIHKMSHATQIKFELKIENIDRLLPKKSEIHYYRIIQEAMTNIMKHSEATSSTVVIHKNRYRIQTTITDNGKGFQIGDHTQEGMGLADMRERTRLIAGFINISSKPEQGFQIHLIIPLSKEG